MQGFGHNRNIKIVRLKFSSSLHLGIRENFLEGSDVIVHSDTLFSAFCHCYLLLYGKDELEKLLAEFLNGHPPFVISSTFPYWYETIYFPLPHNQISRNKEVKKVKFIEKDGFEELINGAKLDDVVFNYKTIPPLKENVKSMYELINNPRLSLNRLSNQPGENFFHFSEIWYREKAGLYFLVCFRNGDFEKRFQAVFRLMAHEGIGGDRGVGKGAFKHDKITINQLEIKVPQKAENTVILSLYHPKNDEIRDLTDGFYEIIERKGYIYSPCVQSIRRKTVNMFSEGSVFPTLKMGSLVDVTPDGFEDVYKHKVYRYGLAFSLPCKKLSDEG